jgi:hypothetical protein
MPLIEFEGFGDNAVERIYLATAIDEADKVQRLFDREDVEYAIEEAPCTVQVDGVPQESSRGMAFHVIRDQADFCRLMLANAGFGDGIVRPDSEGTTP